jgi:signal transduction histidine kinase
MISGNDPVGLNTLVSAVPPAGARVGTFTGAAADMINAQGQATLFLVGTLTVAATVTVEESDDGSTGWAAIPTLGLTGITNQLPLVIADRTLFTRAFTNLVENALQAMPSGGTLRLRGSASEGLVVLEIEDTGVGMDAEGTRRAFEPYFSTKTGGSGLGLANAKRNIELCGGTVSLSSRAGVGTTIRIALSAAPHAVPASS